MDCRPPPVGRDAHDGPEHGARLEQPALCLGEGRICGGDHHDVGLGAVKFLPQAFGLCGFAHDAHIRIVRGPQDVGEQTRDPHHEDPR